MLGTGPSLNHLEIPQAIGYFPKRPGAGSLRIPMRNSHDGASIDP